MTFSINRFFTDFFSDIKRFVAYREVLGIDIGTVAVKMVDLKRTGEQVVLQNYGILETQEYLERGNAAIQTSSLKIVERDVTELLSLLLREVQPATRYATASIPMFGVFVAPIEIPLLPPSELEQVIGFQARQYIPLPLEKVNLEWVKLAEFDSQQGTRYQRLLLVAIPKAIIASYQSLFKAAGLKLIGLEIESNALARALVQPTDPPTMILDIGGESTSLLVVEEGIVKQTGQSDYGGAALTQAVARSLGISTWRAEELKRRRGILGSGAEYDLSTSLTPFLDVIIQECGRVKAAYDRTAKTPVERLLVVGGSANLPGLRQYLTEQAGFKIHDPYPFAAVQYAPELEPMMKSLSNELSVAIGLARKFFLPE